MRTFTDSSLPLPEDVGLVVNRTRKARAWSRCAECQREISPGQMITQVILPPLGWCHSGCVAEFRRWLERGAP